MATSISTTTGSEQLQGAVFTHDCFCFRNLTKGQCSSKKLRAPAGVSYATKSLNTTVRSLSEQAATSLGELSFRPTKRVRRWTLSHAAYFVIIMKSWTGQGRSKLKINGREACAHGM